MPEEPLFTRALLVEDEKSLAEALKIALARLKIAEIRQKILGGRFFYGLYRLSRFTAASSTG